MTETTYWFGNRYFFMRPGEPLEPLDDEAAAQRLEAGDDKVADLSAILTDPDFDIRLGEYPMRPEIRAWKPEQFRACGEWVVWLLED